jgi:flagellar hook-associated protein 1 FlgK
MRSTFGGLETALRALQAHQNALNITGHNIANANTPGYSRQVPGMSTTDPYTLPAFNRPTTAAQMGTGVSVASIIRMRDQFADVQIRQESTTLGRWSARRDNLHQLELIFNEPSDTGIQNALTEFWTSLVELSKRPENTSVRSVVRQTAVVLTDTIKHIYSQVTQLQRDLNDELGIKVNEVNSLAKQIADLNGQIGKVTSLGEQANDLLDQRELLVEKLSLLTNIEVLPDHMNRYQINISGRMLVGGDQVNEIYIDPNPDRDGLIDVKWADNNELVEFRNGEIKGILDVRDEEIPYYQGKLNELAASLIQEINAVHEVGYTMDGSLGVPFFSGNNAQDIQVSNDIMLDERNIAASGNGDAGNGQNALSMANIFQEAVLNAGTATYSSFYAGIISRLGVDAQKAVTMSDNQTVLVGHLKDRQESIAGVSLDEEMANMIKYQHGYNAAARIITTLDETLDTIINRMGV